MKTFCQGGGGPAEPVPYLVPSDWTTKNIRVKAEPVASALLGLRLAFSCSTRGKRAYVLSALRTPLAHANATARACAEERAGIAGLITLRQSLPTYRGCASGTPRRALDSTQGKPCSVALLGLAFTMAEILLSLTIIGVVAAITLPSLTGNINERTWNTQRKALYARFSQAIALMPALNGYGTLRESTDSAGSTTVEDTATETFITSGLSKVLKINNICDSEHIEDCGITSKLTTLNGSIISTPTKMSELNMKMIDNSWSDSRFSYAQLDTKAAAFETANGESIIAFYNPNCQSLMGESTAYMVQPKICANFIFDMNGNKGPNTVGKDIGFMTVLYSTDSAVVAPDVPVQKAASRSATQQEAIGICKEQDAEYRIPSQDELASMFVNQLLLNGAVASTATDYWSSIIYNSTTGWTQGFASGTRALHGREEKMTVHCVKR